MQQIKEELIAIPKNVNIKVSGKHIEVTGEYGQFSRDFSAAPISIELENNLLKVYATWVRKKESALVGTISSHIRNMIIGVTEGFTYKLKIVYSHFPISVKLDRKKIVINNFTGERKSRTAKIVGDVKVEISGDDIIVSGINIENVGQTAANIQQVTRVKGKDPRIFLDGIYVYEKQRGTSN